MDTRADRDLVAGIKRIAETLPPAPSHMLWINWAPKAPRADMAYSVEDNIYIALYGIWKDAEGEAEASTWAVNRMKELAPISTGIQLADENLGERPARFLADSNLARLDRLRAAHDPSGRFHAYLKNDTGSP